jgi:hypothetical protein
MVVEKENVLEIIKNLLNDSNLEDIIYHLYKREKFIRGLKDADEGRRSRMKKQMISCIDYMLNIVHIVVAEQELRKPFTNLHSPKAPFTSGSLMNSIKTYANAFESDSSFSSNRTDIFLYKKIRINKVKIQNT